MNRTAAAGSEALRRWPLVVVLVLSVHLAFGILGRGLWKPDEPREAAIAARMARPGGDLVIPHLGATPFCEKPPLSYWIAAGSIRLLGEGVVPVRLPNVLYALAGAVLVGLLADAAAGRAAALAAGLLMGTFYLAWRVEIWIATDALLMASVAGALFGCFRGLMATQRWGKLGWYTVMHAFLAVGFMTKNVVAWIVPALALAAFAVWERRWRELVSWPLLAGLGVQVAAALPWVRAVAARPDGAEYLRVFFVDNLLGRFTPLQGVGYTEAHRGWLAKYLVELPIYLLPWTLLIVAAVAHGWGMVRNRGRVPDGAAPQERPGWRFAVASLVPALVLLSLSATMRDTYAALLMPGFALLGGLWVQQALERPGRLDVAMVRATGVGLGAVALLLPPAVLAGAWRLHADAGAAAVVLLLAGWAGALALMARFWRRARAGRLGSALAAGAACWVATVTGVAPVLFPLVDRAQDLSPVAEAARAAADRHPLVLFATDETTIGVLDFYAGLTPPSASTDEELRERLAATPDLRVLVEVSAGAGKERRLDELRERFGLAVERRIDLPEPGGRNYAILRAGAPVPPAAGLHPSAPYPPGHAARRE